MPPGPAAAWPVFGFDTARSGNDLHEDTITPRNVGTLTRLWHTSLGEAADGQPVALLHVPVAGGMRDLLYVTTQSGGIVALDQASGAIVWRRSVTGTKFTTSSPAIDPSGQFVYNYGTDGKLHKYDAATGTETVGQGWPATVTLNPDVDKGSSPLNIGNGYVYATTSAYPGDMGHYVGHVVAVSLASGAEHVFNAECANIRQLLSNTPSSPDYCPDSGAGIWPRGGAVVDPATGDIFTITGNGPFTADSGGHDYGETILELSPDLGTLIDSYTPPDYAALSAVDHEIGSAGPALIPPLTGTSTPLVMVQIGKDHVLRLLNRRDLSGQGGPGHVGGDLQEMGGFACEVHAQPAVWSDASGTPWVFIADICGSLYAVKIVVTNGKPALQLVYSRPNIGSTSPTVANGVLYTAYQHTVSALDPETGAVLWSSTSATAGGTIGDIHWQSPIVVNGRLFIEDDSGNVTAYGLK